MPAEPDSRPRDLGRLALSPDEAAEALGVSRDLFDRAIAPGLRMVRVGRRRLVAVAELRDWLDREGARWDDPR